jgi:hypothetical protein
MKIFLMELHFILSPAAGNPGQRTSRRGNCRATQPGGGENARWQTKEDGSPYQRGRLEGGRILGFFQGGQQPWTSQGQEGFTLF